MEEIYALIADSPLGYVSGSFRCSKNYKSIGTDLTDRPSFKLIVETYSGTAGEIAIADDVHVAKVPEDGNLYVCISDIKNDEDDHHFFLSYDAPNEETGTFTFVKTNFFH